ncbi:histidine kinase [Elizabethkingia anophelis]|uniref:ATP-binding protein n=1 Tax=Elizabethkingia anophelis TaxID=1117645 RepID=UPI00099B1B83|nr:tetratricopeptide repeat-containing sensor histidine kinase [Elizabethkingia anophelis]MDV3565281.1 histidine kinase [Elizabethkingia anophelis]MDV3971798.1 histidine kinase [Elizabethkingia anophelis]OPC45408.1 histidine kinase [Elizabethkingia anophelis]QRI49260.1 tetratricopeptide repeat protein [Elizabethkingia anophelis]
MKHCLFFLITAIFITSCTKTTSTRGTTAPHSISNPDYDKAWKFIDKGDDKNGFIYLDKAKDAYIKAGDSFSAGKSFVNMAIIQERVSDNMGSIETSITALKFLNEKNPNHHGFLSSNYNNMGVASNSLKNYADAEKYYKKAYQFSQDKIEKIMIMNNLANCYHNQKKYREAASVFKKIKDSLQTKDDIYYKISSNLAKTLWYEEAKYNPTPVYLEAKKYYAKEKDDWGLDASYAYLSEYYLHTNKDSAMFYSNKMYDIANKLKSPADRLEALQNMIVLEKGDQSKKHFTEYYKLSDSIQESNNTYKNQFAAIRFESDKNRIAKLNLEKDLVHNQYKIIRQQVFIYSVSGILIILLITGVLWYKRRKAKLELVTQNKIKEERLILSKKVHDVVANGLYQVMSKIEYNDNFSKDEILNKLEMMYQKSRDISYTPLSSSEKKFKDRISELCLSFQNSLRRIFVVGNEDAIWYTLNADIQEEVFLILQEFLVNTKKHSQADRVVIKFSSEEGKFHLRYSDNGTGLDEKTSHNNGLKNIQQRATHIKGILHILPNEGKGFLAEISIP